MCKKFISSARRVAGWQEIRDAIREARNVFDMAEHDSRDKSSRNKVWQLLTIAQEIAQDESSYCSMKDYNGCFIPEIKIKIRRL